MAEEQEGNGSLKSILIGLASTVAIAVGGFVTKQLTGEEEKAAEPATTVSAPAPVININQAAAAPAAPTGGTRVVERVVEKPAAPKKKTEKEALQEEPKW
jgi:flagellar basal body-associated protein FliL